MGVPITTLLEESIRVHGIEWVAVFAYFDETGGSDKPLTAVAGYLFDASGVERFRSLYRERLEPLLPVHAKKGVKIFHAAPCYDGDAEYFGHDRPIREYWLALMAGIIKDSARMGVVVGVETDEYLKGISTATFKVKRGGQPVESLRPWVGSAYSLCLFRCVQGINDWMAENDLRGPIEYTMEAGKPDENAEAARVFANVAKSNVIQARYRFGSSRFVPKAPDNPWLFGADYLAWWWQRNHYVSAKDTDASLQWQRPVVPLIESVKHLGSHMGETAVGIQGLINAFYGLMRDDAHTQK